MKIIRVITFCLLLFAVLTGCSFYESSVLYSYERDAEESFEKQKYESAVAKYHYLYTNHPNPEKKEEYLLQKGRALYLIRSYHDAEEIFEQHLREFPKGEHRAEAEAYLTKIEALRTQKARSDNIREARIRGDVELMKQMVKNDPYNAKLHYELANKLWELGNYNESALHYLKAGEIDAALQENSLIKNRLMINERGKVVPITPELQEEMERENNPLVIFDTHAYKQRIKPDVLGASKAFFTVTGKIRNQSQQTRHNVVVAVHFYNMHHEILDTQKYYVGTMGPREVRAFLVKGQNYDNIYNIEDYEFNVYYQ